MDTTIIRRRSSGDPITIKFLNTSISNNSYDSFAQANNFQQDRFSKLPYIPKNNHVPSAEEFFVLDQLELLRIKSYSSSPQNQDFSIISPNIIVTKPTEELKFIEP